MPQARVAAFALLCGSGVGRRRRGAGLKAERWPYDELDVAPFLSSSFSSVFFLLFFFCRSGDPKIGSSP